MRDVVTLAPTPTKVLIRSRLIVWSRRLLNSAGNVYLGTGRDGKLFRIGADGEGALLYKAAESDVTALC